MSNIYLNCGEYAPGQEPRTPTTSNTVPGDIVPNPSNTTPVFNTPTCPEPNQPQEPGFPTPGIPPVPTPPPGPNTPPPPPPPPPTTGGPAGPSAPAPGGPITGGPAGPSTPIPGGGPTTGGPAGPSTPAPGAGVTGGVRGPTTGGTVRYKCVETILYCEGDQNLQPVEARRIAAISRNCTTCNPEGLEGEPDPTCIYPTRSACESSPCQTTLTPENCIGPTTPGGSTTINEGGSVIPQNQTFASTSIRDELLRRIGNLGGTTTTTTNTTVNSNQALTNLQTNSSTNLEIVINVNSQLYGNFTSQTPETFQLSQQCAGLFQNPYNFFNTPTSQQTTLVNNNLRLDVFSNQISEEVSYFLNNENTRQAWSEDKINNLTLEKVGLSLSPSLFQAVNNLHDYGNNKIDPNVFYSVIKSHLVKGTLSEVDTQYFLRAYERQQGDPRYTYSETGQTPAAVNLALSIYNSYATNPNYDGLNIIIINDDYKRMRFLPEDLNCRVSVLQSDGLLYELPTTNFGIPTQQIPDPNPLDLTNPASGIPLSFGNGAGYYFSTVYLNGQQYPLPTINDLSSSYYIDFRNRANILRLLNADPSLTFKVSSLANQSEISISSYNGSADVDPMYFKLNLDTVGDILTPNSVIGIISATYSKINETEAIEHSRNYGYNISKLNVDFRDPFIHYARDTGILHFEMNDFNLRSLNTTLTPITGRNMLRNIPQAVILTPGCGTSHNPFNGHSELTSYDTSFAIRTYKGQPGIGMSTSDREDPSVEEERIYSALQSNSYGLYEQYLNNDIHGFLYTYNPSATSAALSYYINEEYSNTQPASSLRTNSPEGKFYSMASRLRLAVSSYIDSINPDEQYLWSSLRWYDLYTRLTLNDAGRLLYSNTTRLFNDISNGLIYNTPVTLVSNTFNEFNTGVPVMTPLTGDLVQVITEADRLEWYYANYPPPEAG